MNKTLNEYEQLSMLNTNFSENSNDINHPFPKTRYQGSKYKLTDWIWGNIKILSFTTVLDAFGGTGSVSHMLKRNGKEVTYNDLLKFNYVIGKALIENNSFTFDDEDIKYVFTKHDGVLYPTFIQETYKNIFYLDEENSWLDIVTKNIKSIKCEYKQSIAWYALFQSCIIKRPYNLFHRANLYIRTANVKRSFGNKASWDKPFEEHFIFFIKQANQAIFDNNKLCKAINYDSLEIPQSQFDLVYIDTPYITNKGIGTDYLDFYHFLEGLLDYKNWDNRILRRYKHLPIAGKGENDWINKKLIYNSFDRLFEKFRDSILVISYRNDGIPTEEELIRILKKYKTNIREIKSKDYKYALSNNQTSEILIIAE